MSAFNDIEHHLRSALGAAQYVDFTEMVHDFGETNNLTRRQIDTLFAFRSLRNAICHSRYYHGQPIAEPVMEVVRQIERLRDQIKRPPKAIDILGKQDIGSVDLDEPIGTALGYIPATSITHNSPSTGNKPTSAYSPPTLLPDGSRRS